MGAIPFPDSKRRTSLIGARFVNVYDKQQAEAWLARSPLVISTLRGREDADSQKMLTDAIKRQRDLERGYWRDRRGCLRRITRKAA